METPKEQIEEAKTAQIRYELRMEALRMLDDELFVCNARTVPLKEIQKEIEEERRQIFIALGLEQVSIKI